MAEISDEAKDIEKLYELGERLNEARDKAQVRVQAIRGLPLFSKDIPEYLPKIVDVLVQLLPAEENVERDAVHKAIMSLLRQDVKEFVSRQSIERRSNQSPFLEKYEWLGFLVA